MRRVLLIAALLCAACSRGESVSERTHQSQPVNGPVTASVIPADDLPPQGTRSLFDHWLAQNDGLKFPFDRLVALLQATAPDGRAPASVMIPAGRSLLKAQADFAHPRVLVAADFEGKDTPASIGLAPRGQLFLGFVENAAEIEVISYNEAAGRFEFQLVQNYCSGCVPRIVYARRAICTTCHQGGAPIFPQRPWNETNGQSGIAEKIRAARGSDTAYLGLPLTQSLSAPERFDQLTDVGNFIPAAQRVWLDGCGSEASARPATDGRAGADSTHASRAMDGDTAVACRRSLLKAALHYLRDPGGFDPHSTEAQALRETQAKHWPETGIVVSQSDLPNRDPLAETHGVRGFFRALLTRKPPPGAGARNNEDLEAFDKLPKLPVQLDPLTPRAPRQLLTAQDLDGVSGLAQFFTEADAHRLDAATQGSAAKLDAAVNALPESFFAPAPFARVKTLQALLAVLHTPSPQYCCLDVSEMSPPQASGVPPLALAKDSPLQPFADHCFACHRGNPAKRLDFMSGANESEVAVHIKAKSEIREVLDWPRYRGTDKASKLMPPADSPQRAALEAAVAKDPQLLEKMRAQVQGLFDF